MVLPQLSSAVQQSLTSLGPWYSSTTYVNLILCGRKHDISLTRDHNAHCRMHTWFLATVRYQANMITAAAQPVTSWWITWLHAEWQWSCNNSNAPQKWTATSLTNEPINTHRQMHDESKIQLSACQSLCDVWHVEGGQKTISHHLTVPLTTAELSHIVTQITWDFTQRQQIFWLT